MKILLLHDLQADKQNGVSVSLGILSRELGKLGYDVKILTLADGTKSFCDGSNYCLSSLPALIYPGIRLRPPVKHRYIDEIIEWCPDIIHTNCEFSTFLIAKYIQRKCIRKPAWVHTFHTDYKYYIGLFQKLRTVRDSLVPKFLNSCFRKSDALIVPTMKMYHYVNDKEFTSTLKIKVIPTGIDFTELDNAKGHNPDETRTELGIPENSKMILFLGRISAEKNLDELVECFAEYCKTRNDVYLVTVGNGPYKDTISKKVKKLGIQERCIIHEGVPHTEIRRFYDAADVFASASVSETQGLTFYEALYCGVPVLAKDRECLEDAIHEGENGAFFDSPENFAEAIEKIIDKKDASGTQNTKLPECFESEFFANSVSEVYKEILFLRSDKQNKKNSIYGKMLEKGKKLKYRLKK